MKAFLIDPEMREIKEIGVRDMDDVRAAVDCILHSVLTISPPHFIIYDFGNGSLRPEPRSFRWSGTRTQIFSKAVLIGFGKSGEFVDICDCSLMRYQVMLKVQFCEAEKV